MGIKRLKTYRLTCDGVIMWTSDWGERVPTPCDAVVTLKAKNRDALVCDLPSGWRLKHSLVNSDDLLCPRSDYL